MLFYRAAVVEFAPNTITDVERRLIESFAEYIKFIKQAADQGADIIVFPEGGLTGVQLTRKEIDKIAIRIVNNNNQTLCLNLNKTYNQFLTSLSCAARNNKIYVVVNIIEKDDYKENYIYYSTNIVFSKEGKIIARYRKINLYTDELSLTKGNSLTTFNTDFGVDFGIFTSNDIMYQNPSLTVLQNSNISNVIYSAAWYPTTSFFTANGIQHGYAKSNGVNLLAAGLCNPSKQNGGSGIYLHTGEISQQYICSRNVSKILVADIPIIESRRNLLHTCQNKTTTIYTKNENVLDISGVNISNYNHKVTSLNLEKNEVTETLCGIEHDFCCTFNIVFNVTGVPNYYYKLVVYKDTLSIPFEGCGLITCLNSNIESCGKRNKFPPSGITFSYISIETVSLIKDEDRPVMLLEDLTASNNYNYCKQKTGRKVNITMSTVDKENHFLVFGIFILGYNLDDSNGFVNFNAALMKIAAIGGFATASMGYAAYYKINSNISRTQYYQDAISTLKSHSGVIYLLGNPISVGKIDVGDEKRNWCKPLSVHFEVPVKGSKEKGVLYFWARRESDIDNWIVNRMELQLQKEPHRRLLIKNIEINL
ncbi:hypothetical protein RN001_000797 [Aquatica leii]|uniref:CN hydrolase domain-containing protein n=1 Tax=Aquatica leii TaxID=1421715 RepID=A0AAN7PMR1_9COLE|nr:hypothetical protein RN001_000797 [Aquatica leii]